MRTLFSSLLLAASLAACSPYDPDLGPAPFLCGPADQNPRCPEGYFCQMTGGQEVCLSPNGGMVPDGGNQNGNCADDSQLEPNESTMQAFVTPVATQKNNLVFAGLAICPAGDKDTYSVTINVANQNLEMLIEFDPAGADLQGGILNSGGFSINMLSPMGEGMKRAYTPNLPPGTYYAQVYGPANGQTTNNYKLTLNATGP